MQYKRKRGINLSEKYERMPQLYVYSCLHNFHSTCYLQYTIQVTVILVNNYIITLRISSMTHSINFKCYKAAKLNLTLAICSAFCNSTFGGNVDAGFGGLDIATFDLSVALLDSISFLCNSGAYCFRNTFSMR